MTRKRFIKQFVRTRNCPTVVFIRKLEIENWGKDASWLGEKITQREETKILNEEEIPFRATGKK